MDLSGIISIAGMSGLYKVIAQTKSGLVVESLLDKKRVPAYSTSKVSTLEEVSIYSTGYNTLQKEGLLAKKEETKEKEDKPKIKADAKGAVKTKMKDTTTKPAKTASSKVKTQGVRKTGVA